MKLARGMRSPEAIPKKPQTPALAFLRVSDLDSNEKLQKRYSTERTRRCIGQMSTAAMGRKFKLSGRQSRSALSSELGCLRRREHGEQERPFVTNAPNSAAIERANSPARSVVEQH